MRFLGGPGELSRYSDWLRAGRSGDRIPVGPRFSALVQTDTGVHTASCTIGTGSFPGVKCGRGVRLNPHPLPVPWSRKSRAIPLLPTMGRTACTEPQCLYSTAIPLLPTMGCTACTQPQCLYSTAIPLLPLWAVRPVQSLSACTRVHFPFFTLQFLDTGELQITFLWRPVRDVFVPPDTLIEHVILTLDKCCVLLIPFDHSFS